MRAAYGEIRDVYRSRADVPDVRIAAFVLAIQKVARFWSSGSSA